MRQMHSFRINFKCLLGKFNFFYYNGSNLIFWKRSMGNSHKAESKQAKIKMVEKIPQKDCLTKDNTSQNEDDIIEEGLNIQFVERNDFKFSQQVLASKNLMVSNCIPSRITLGCPRQLEKDNDVHDILSSFLLPSTSTFYKKINHLPQFQIIKIDFKKFVSTKMTSILDQYFNLQKIGDGSFGVVYRAEMKNQPGQYRAIKKINKSQIRQCDQSQLINQIEILRKCDHPNIIKIYEIYEDKDYYYVVSELCTGGNLLQYLNCHDLFQYEIKIIMTQVLSALKYLHNMNIAHRDIKLENLLVVQNNLITPKSIQIKVIDFGLSVDLSTITSYRTDEMAGTLLYMSPESLYGEISLKSDIWSCGVMLYVLLTKRFPYKYNDEDDLMKKIDDCRIMKKYLYYVSPKAKALIYHMLQKDVNRRCSAKRALENEWLKDAILPSLSKSQRRRTASVIQNYHIKNNLISMIESFIVFKKVSQQERQRLAVVFSQIDKDKSGVIDVKEFKAFYSQNSDYYDEQEIQELIKVIDKNKSGFIDFTEFLIVMYNRKEIFHMKNLKEAFKFLDLDRSEHISKQQIKKALPDIKDEEVDSLFVQLDKDANKKISKNQFFKYFRTNQF